MLRVFVWVCVIVGIYLGYNWYSGEQAADRQVQQNTARQNAYSQMTPEAREAVGRAQATMDGLTVEQEMFLGAVISNKFEEASRLRGKIPSLNHGWGGRPGTPPLLLTIQADNEAGALWLLDQPGIDANYVGQASRNLLDTVQPIHLAARRGMLKVVKKLLDSGAQTDALSKEGATPLMRACEGNDLATVKFLLSKGADATRADKEGRTPLHYAVMGYHRGATDNTAIALFNELAKRGADVNVKTAKLQTPLALIHLDGGAYDRGRTRVAAAKWFVDKGYDLNTPTYDRTGIFTTVTHIYVHSGDLASVQEIKKLGANFAIRLERVGTPLERLKSKQNSQEPRVRELWQFLRANGGKLSEQVPDSQMVKMPYDYLYGGPGTDLNRLIKQ